MSKLTHFDPEGRAVMVDVSDKDITERVATAGATVTMQPATLQMIQSGGHKKGDVLAVARLAGIMAAKQTPNLIPLCHPLPLSSVRVDLKPDMALPGLRIEATCKVTGQTGVEMEALTAASVAALTLYDMCKAIDRGMTIETTRLVHKTGGASGDWHRERHD